MKLQPGNSHFCVIVFLFSLLILCTMVSAQELDGKPYTPGVDPNIDMFISDWRKSLPRHSHGSLIERDILTKGDPVNPTTPGAVLLYINRFVHATLDGNAATTPTRLSGEQEIFFILSGKGAITAGGKTYDLYSGIAVLVPADLEFVMKNTGSEAMTIYLLNEPVPSRFRPNKSLLVRDENTTPVVSYNGHWCHIVKPLFSTNDGLGTLESVITVSFDPMTIGHPHSHVAGCEEVWTAIQGTSYLLLGKQLRKQPPGVGYLIPPNGNTPHSNINTSDTQIKMFYFARYRDHDVRK